MATMSSHGRDQVEALLAIITSAARDAVASYSSSSGGGVEGEEIPTFASRSAHPLDFATGSAEKSKLKKSVRLLEGACEALCAVLAPPAHTIINVRISYLMPFPLSTLIFLVSNSEGPKFRLAVRARRRAGQIGRRFACTSRGSCSGGTSEGGGDREKQTCQDTESVGHQGHIR